MATEYRRGIILSGNAHRITPGQKQKGEIAMTENDRVVSTEELLARQVSALVSTMAEAIAGRDDTDKLLKLEMHLYQTLAANCQDKARITGELLNTERPPHPSPSHKSEIRGTSDDLPALDAKNINDPAAAVVAGRLSGEKKSHEELKMVFEAQANWQRQKNEEYAAEIFDRLAATADDVPVHLLNAYSDVFARAANVGNAALNNAVTYEEQALKDVGFQIHPETAADFIEAFLKLNADFSRRDPPYRPKPVE